MRWFASGHAAHPRGARERPSRHHGIRVATYDKSDRLDWGGMEREPATRDWYETVGRVWRWVFGAALVVGAAFVCWCFWLMSRNA